MIIKVIKVFVVLNYLNSFNPELQLKGTESTIKNKLKKTNQAANHLFLPNIKLFKRTKSGLELVFVLHFLNNF